MTKIRLVALATLAVLAIVGLGAARAQSYLQPEDVANLTTVSDPRLSPDGRNVVYVQTLPAPPDEERRPNRTLLRLVPAEGGGDPRAFTSADGRANEPRWSPDGRLVAFLDRRPFDDADAKAQIFVIPVDGGEARRVSDAPEGVSEYAWSSDGETLLYTSRDPKPEERLQAEKQGRDWEVVDQDYRHLRLYEIGLDGGEARRVSEADLTLRDIAVSPDGRFVAALAAHTPKVDDSYVFLELVRIDVGSGKVEVVWDMPGKASSPRFSPDGNSIACLAGVAARDPLPGSLFLIPATGGEARNLTPGYAGTVEWFDFDAAGRLLVVATHGVWTHLERIAPSSGAVEVLLDRGPVYTGAHLAPAAGLLVARASTPEHPDEIFVRPLGTGDWRRLTSSYPRLDGIRLGRQEPVQWTARDGLAIEGVLVYPLDYREGRRYPLVVGIHGGPEGAILNGWHTGYGYLSQLLAQRGAFFLLPNYRGSSGRGVGFLLADHGDPAGSEFQDVLDGIAALVERGMVDDRRVGIMGGSYGGYFSAWGATRESAHFRAAVVNFGVSNLWSDWGDGDIPWEHRLVHWGWFPVDRPLLAMDRSPVTWTRGSRTATLIMHGKDDPRVPAAQSKELYQGLRLNEGLPVELVLFPREGHGYREAAHRLEACRRALAWMESHLGLSSAGEVPGGP